MNPLITKLALALFGGLLYVQVSAQTPALINYQAVARNAATGSELSNQALYLILKVRSGSPIGNIVYQEEHLDASTNEFGLFNIQIGAGSPLIGNFSSINWGQGQYWLEIDMDAGSGIETLGSMQFVSVPYALHAGSADNVDDEDADPTNELITDISIQDNHILSVLEGANVHSVDLSSLVNLNDIDPTNELITNLSLVDGNTLTINEGPNTHQLDLSSLVNLDDIDPTNELQTLAEVIAYSSPQGSAGSQRITDLSNPVDEQDAATKTYVDNFILTGDLDQTLENPRVVGLQNRPITATPPVNGQVLVYNQVTGNWQPQTLPSSPLSGEQYYSFDISAFAESKKDGSADKTNMVIYTDDLHFLTLYRGDEGNLFIAPLNLLDGAKITEIKYAFKKLQGSHQLRFRLMRYNAGNGSVSVISTWNTSGTPTSANIQNFIQDVTGTSEEIRTIDNSTYTYRLELQFSIGSSTYDVLEDVRLMFYGANLKYSY